MKKTIAILLILLLPGMVYAQDLFDFTSKKASKVKISDSGDYYTATNVEDALQALVDGTVKFTFIEIGDANTRIYRTANGDIELEDANAGGATLTTLLGSATGDITDVFDVSSGAATAVTIGSGQYLDGGTATSDAAGEGILLPRATDVSAATAEGQISWDSDDDTLYIGDGSSAVAITGGGTTDDDVTVNSTAVDTTANFLDNIYADFDITDGGAGGPDDITLKFEYAQTLAGNPALLVDEIIFFADVSGAGFLCEGSTADTNEQLYRFPDANGADTTEYIVVADDANVSSTEAGYLDGVAGAIYYAGGTDVVDADVADDITITNISQVGDITASASEINTPLDGALVTLTEFQELETIGATTISANQWAVLGGIAETLTSAELDILDGVTGVTAAELSYIGDVTSAIQAQLNAKEGTLTNSAGLAGALSDETGTGLAVFGTSPTLTTPTIGVATATSINKVTITAPATSATITATDGTTTTLSGGTHSGTNTGDQTITLTGDVTGSGTGSFTATIADSVAVTSWNLTTPTITTSLTTSTPTTLSAAELDRLDGLTSAIIDDDKIDTFSELDTIVADKALVNKADGAVWLGVHDFGGATSTEIVNGTDPTTDAAGEIAIDTNSPAAYGGIEIYAATGSALIPAIQHLHKTIIDPDGIQSTEDAIPLMRVETEWAPHGITILDIFLSADASNSGTYVLEEWTDPATYGSDIESCTFSASTEFEDDGTLADASIAAGSYVFIDFDTTALNFLSVHFTYIINPGA